MNATYIKSISLSLLKKKSEIDSSTFKAEYLKLATASFNNLLTNLNEQDLFKTITSIYQDLLSLKSTKNLDCDYIGIWVDYKNKTYDNAILLETLSDIKQYGTRETVPIVEFLKMSIPNDNNEEKQ